ncbi:hypothetical protein [Larkinella rosea]|uniref:DUF2490 domain-containing protein n=1 Tax=Larkinella rosea TaxID=2025312 RepID=A0A3P1BFR6_9BACT|nr:hypothetical protein [Larkinella rosea]RRA99918.1 hypothetical protein EHT25_25135 [Larkinella rosea]
MKLIFLLALLATYPVWGQSDDSTATPAIPPKSNFRSSWIMEPGFAYAITSLPTMRGYFRTNQIKVDNSPDRVALASFAYRRQRFKVALQAFFAIDKSLLPPDKKGNSLFARRQNMSGVTFLLGYDVANTRNKRVFINAGLGSLHYEYSIFRATNQSVSFQNLLQYSPPGSVPSLIQTTGFWDVNVEVVQREKRPNTFQWVSRFGYRRSFQRTPWRSDAFELTDAPKERMGQFYLQIGVYISRNFSGRQKP